MTSDALPQLPPRRADAHKGDFGRVLCLGGSRGMSGAIALTGMAALRSGAGLVSLAIPADTWKVVAELEPGYVTVPLPEDDEGRVSSAALATLQDHQSNTDVLAIGPGMGQGAGVKEVVQACYTQWEVPIVVDADALNTLATIPKVLAQHAGPRILTPHPGEFKRLTGDSESSHEAAVAFAGEHRVVLVLKGHQTLVTDGSQRSINSTGNPGMATGGSGDVLTGVIAAIIGQGLSAFEAAQLGVHVHGLAGDLAVAQLGAISLTARDLVQTLPQAWQQVQSG